jgi:hypothetical protein
MSDTATTKKSGEVTSSQGSKPAGESKAKMPGADFGVSATSADAKPLSSSNSEERERNEVFGSLVKGDDDIVGLVAYSIYKQNKHDWLVAFNKAKAREPNEDEAFSYIAGESTVRRLAIYRHLAQATLEGRGPQVTGNPGKEKFVQANLASGSSQPEGGAGKGLMWIGALIAVVVALYIGAKFGMPGVPR